MLVTLAVILVALAAAGYLAWERLPGLRTLAQGDPVAVLEPRVAALEKSAAARPADANAELTGQVARLARDLDAAKQQLAQAQAKLAEVAQRPAASASSGGDASALQASLARTQQELSDRMDALSTRTDTALTQARDELRGRVAADTERVGAGLDAVEKRVAALEKPGQGATAAALALAVQQLRTATRGDAPFQPTVEAVRPLLGDDAAAKTALAGWAERADKGVPDLATLTERFPAEADAARAALRQDWVDETVARLGSLVRLRRTGVDIKGDDVDSRLARAEAHLQRQELAAALAEVEAVPAPAAERLAGWRADARARLALEQGLGTLERLATRRLAAAPGAP